MKRFIISIFFLSLWANALAMISVELSATDLTLGEPLRATFNYDPTSVHTLPELSPLQTDFTILATEQSTSYTVIQGQARSIGQWSIVLEAKRVGHLTIPPLHFGQEWSAPTPVTIHPTAVQSAQGKPLPAGEADGLKMIGLISDHKPYLHQEILYTVRLLNRQRLGDLRYTPPEVTDAILLPLGPSRQYQTTDSGLEYDVDEQTYAIFPQKSGHLSITPPSLRAL